MELNLELNLEFNVFGSGESLGKKPPKPVQDLQNQKMKVRILKSKNEGTDPKNKKMKVRILKSKSVGSVKKKK